MNTQTKKLTVSALLIALSAVLAAFPILRLPNDGTITLASMVPVIVIGFLFGTKHGIISAFVFSLIQMVTGGIATPPVENFVYYALVVLLDYVIAFTVLGTAPIFEKMIGNKTISMPISGGIVVFLRFVCHYISGVIIWGVYAPEGQSPYLYSLLYNGSYMGIELVVTVVVLAVLTPLLLKYKRNYNYK